MKQDTPRPDPAQPAVPNNKVEELLLEFCKSHSRLVEVKLFQALVDEWVAVVAAGEYSDEEDSMLLPLVLTSPQGYQVAALFTSEERVVPAVHERFPDHKFVMWTTTKHVLKSLPDGIGVVLNVFGPFGAQWDPTDFQSKLRWIGAKPDPRPWWRKLLSP